MCIAWILIIRHEHCTHMYAYYNVNQKLHLCCNVMKLCLQLLYFPFRCFVSVILILVSPYWQKKTSFASTFKTQLMKMGFFFIDMMLSNTLTASANRISQKYLFRLPLLFISAQVIILDVRVPCTPVARLNNHRACVNGIAWAPHSSCHICTSGESATVLQYTCMCTC